MTTYRMLGVARSTNEVRFLLALERCPSCGERDIGEPRYNRSYVRDERDVLRNGGFLDTTCPRCGEQRHVSFYETDVDFWKDWPRSHVGGPESSGIIAPHLLARELLWALGLIDRDISTFEAMTEDQRRYHNDFWAIGSKCVTELLKFLNAGTDEVPDSAFTSDDARAFRAEHPEVFQRTFLENAATLLAAIRTELERVWKKLQDEKVAAGVVEPPKPLPLPPFSLAALKFHEKWLAEGDVDGAQRMTGKGIDINGRNLSDRDLSRVEVQHITFDRASLTRSHWREASIDGAQGFQSHWESARITSAVLARSTFASSKFIDTHFCDSYVQQTKFISCDLSRSLWGGARISYVQFIRSTLVDVSLDDALIADCVFTGCDLSATRLGPLGTTCGAVFLRCDLRDTNWEGRDLFRARFVDCKMAGVRGIPLVGGIVIEAPDLSEGGDGSRIGTAEDVLRAWSGDAAANDDRDVVYDLSPDGAATVVELARSLGVESRTWVVTRQDGYHHRVRLRGLHGDAREQRVHEEAARWGRVLAR